MEQRSLPHRPPHDPPRPAVFLDRDDTLIENAALPDAAFPHTRGDLFCPEFVRLLPGVAGACARLADAGFALVVVTNQGGVARGGATVEQVEATNDRVRELLTPGDRCLIEAFYAAPHHPGAAVPRFRAEHPWRKPGPGMLRSAAEELGLDLSRSWLVGDAERDADAGIAAGLDPARCLRVGPGAALVGLADAADRILDGDRSGVAIPASVVTLRARTAGVLADEQVARTVESAAHALAERTGVRLLGFTIEPGSVRATIAGSRLAALGFMAELRRSTNTWFASRTPGPDGAAGLWHEHRPPDDEPDDDS